MWGAGLTIRFNNPKTKGKYPKTTHTHTHTHTTQANLQLSIPISQIVFVVKVRWQRKERGEEISVLLKSEVTEQGNLTMGETRFNSLL